MSAGGVGRYRKVYPRIWRHPGFRGLRESARLLALYVLTGPQSNRCGVSMFSVATAAEDLGVSVETLRKGLADVSGTFGWLFDAEARVLYIPSWWAWNRPENNIVLAGNLKDFNEVPPCALTEAFACNLETLPQTFHQTFAEGTAQRLRQGSSNQKQELYLKQEKKQRAARGEGSERTLVTTPTRDERLRYRTRNPKEPRTNAPLDELVHATAISWIVPYRR